jgi:hypothetical protein
LVLSGSVRPAFVTFGVACGSVTADQVADSVMQATLAASSFNSRLDSSVTVAEVRVSKGEATGEDTLGSESNTAPGGMTITSPPANVALLVAKRTERGGRRGRGRLFLPWYIPETDIAEDGTIQSSSLVGIQAALNTWLTQLASGSTPMVVLHRPGLTTPGVPNIVTALPVQTLVATQRRRLGR